MRQFELRAAGVNMVHLVILLCVMIVMICFLHVHDEHVNKPQNRVLKHDVLCAYCYVCKFTFVLQASAARTPSFSACAHKVPA